MRAARHAVHELGVGRVGLRVAQVGTDRVVEQVRVLHHEADRRAERVERELAHVVAVDPDRALLDVGDARHEHRGGGLARAGRTDERDELARLDGER